ncbi:MAG: alpha/beta hydrolase [Myxococcota bacterium]
MRMSARPRLAHYGLFLALGTAGCRPDTAVTVPTEGSQPPETATTPSPVVTEANCPRGLSARARCGSVKVFENRATASGRTIDLAFVVLPPKNADEAQPDPVFVLAGGPGQAATQALPIAGASLARANETRPLVFVDQRGTGASNGLQCVPESLDAMLRGPWHPDNHAFLRQCRDELPADLTQYATPTAMDDLDDVRAALGYDTINLWGGSYGTRAGLAYIRQHGEHVRSAVLWGVAPPGQPFPATFAPVGQAAFERLIADCAADAGCARVLPDGAATLDRILDRLAKAPAEVTVTDPRTKQPATITLTREMFADGLRLTLYDASWSAGLPAMLTAADAGNYEPMLSLMVPLTVAIISQIHLGMFLSVACSEDIPLLTTATDDAARGTFMGTAPLDGLRHACEPWPRAALPTEYLEPVTSDVPVLLMAGELDPVTPPATARSAASTLSNSRVVALPNVGHGTSNARECESSLTGRFFENPEPAALDDACTAGLSRPPFAVPPG